MNTALTNCSEEPSLRHHNDTVEAHYIVDLDVVKVADGDYFGIGDIVTFTITITNNGIFNATNIVVKDILPEGLELVKGNLNQTIPFLEVNKSIDIIVQAKTTRAGNFTNAVSVYCYENTTVVEDNVTIPVFATDIKINKTADVESTIVGKLINFTIVVKNHSTSKATGIVVSDLLDTSAFVVKESSDEYTQDGNNLIWKISQLSGEESYTIWIVVEALTNGTFVNNATVNCNEEPTIKHSDVNVTVYRPGLSVVKIAMNEHAKVGDAVGFKIIVTNTGDMVLNDVFVEEKLPEGLVYDYFVGPNWTNSGTRFYYNASLGVGESAELIIVVNATKSGNFTNVVIAGSNATGNVSDSANVFVGENGVPEKPVKQAIVNDKATGNPIIALLLVIFVLVPLRRRRK